MGVTVKTGPDIKGFIFRCLFTGADPWDRTLDDATYLRGATKTGHHKRIMGWRPHSTLRGPLWRVWLARQMCGGLPLCPPLWLAVFFGWTAARIYLLAITTAVVGGGIVLANRWWQWRPLRSDLIEPAWAAVCRDLGVAYSDRDAHANIQLPAHYQKPGDKAPARIYLPFGATLEDRGKTRLLNTVSAYLGISDPKASWHLRGSRPYLDITDAPKLPDLVPIAKWRQLIDGLPNNKVLLGMATGNEPVCWDMTDEAAHWLISAAPGSGKSVQIRTVIPQLLARGYGAIFLDRKRHSHPWAWDLPNCVYAHKLDHIAQLLVMTQQELQRRADLDPDDLARCIPLVVVVEEAQLLLRYLQIDWMSRGGFRMAPGVLAMIDLITMGREMRIRLAYVAQRASAATFGGNGGDLRDCFSLATIGRWKAQSWKMLADGAQYLKPPPGAGGLAMVQRGEARLYRGLFGSNEEAREIALSGAQIVDVRSVLGGDGKVLEPSNDDLQLETPRLPELATVAEMCAEGALPGPQIGKEALRKWLQRNVPPQGKRGGNENIYPTAPVIEWRSKFADDFELAAVGPQGFCYALYGYRHPGGGQEGLIYIGQSNNPHRRLEEHRENAPFGDLITRMEIIWKGWPTPDELFAVEMRLIGQGWQGELPWANHEGNLSNPNRIPIPVQREQRQLREPGWQPPDKGERYVPLSQRDTEWPVLAEVS